MFAHKPIKATMSMPSRPAKPLFARPLRWAVLVGWLAALGGAHAQGQSAAAPLRVGMETRVMACTVCHGKEGRATPHGYFPRIAGKPAVYLANQLRNFKEGRRSYPLMGDLLVHLSDDYLQAMAQHFAGLDLPYPPPPPPSESPTVLAQGRQLVFHGDPTRGLPACVQCHGGAMTGVQPAIPGLLGLSRDYLNSQLGAWKTGQRRAQSPDCMAQIAKALSPSEVTAVAAWLAAQPLPAVTKPATHLPAPLPMACGGVEGLPITQGASR